MHKKIFGILAVCSVLFVGPVFAHAEEIEEETEVEAQLISAPVSNQEEYAQEFGGMFVYAGDTVRLDTVINKDAFLAGNVVTVDVPVEGDVFAAGSEVQITEPVNGSVRAAGNSVIIDAEVFGNVLVFGSSIRLTENAVVHGYLNAYGASIILDGTVEKSADLRGADIAVNGTLGQTAYLEGSSIQFGSTAIISQATTVRSSTAPVLMNGAVGTELVNFVQISEEEGEATEDRFSAADIFSWFGWVLFQFVAFFLLLLVLIAVFPSMFNQVNQVMREKAGKAWGWGALVFLLMPSALIVAALTIVGFPLAFFTGVVYVVTLILAELMTAVLLGRWLLKTSGAHASKGKLIGAGALGLGILCVVVSIPFIGWLVKIAAMLYGLGGFLIVVMHHRKQK